MQLSKQNFIPDFHCLPIKILYLHFYTDDRQVKFMFHVHYSHKSELQIKPVTSPGEKPNRAQVADHSYYSKLTNQNRPPEERIHRKSLFCRKQFIVI